MLVTISLQAQVTIGSSKRPVGGALLMLDDGTVGDANENAQKGLGLPRVKLQAYDKLQMGEQLAPELVGKEVEHTGLVVYNLADESTKCDFNHPTTGLYVWNGTRWDAVNAEPHYSPTIDLLGPPAVYAPNSYIAVAGSTITIPVEKAFAIWDWWGGGDHPEGKLLTETSASFTGNLTASILWEETEEAVSTSGSILEFVSFVPTGGTSTTSLDRDASIYVKVKNNAVGNAVVTLKDGTGQVRWSWHVWVPKDDPTITTYTHNTGRQTNTFMDRNLGASRNGIVETDRNYTVGLSYQWGRKDPLPVFVKFNDVKTSVPVTSKMKFLSEIQTNNGNGKPTGLKYAINNPLSFIKGSAGSYDWYSTANAQWNARWGNVQKDCDIYFSHKSEMDPCPESWRIPTYIGPADADSPWAKDGVTSEIPSDYTNSAYDKGYDFIDVGFRIGWYPAAGFRHHDGRDFDLGIHGDYWTASANKTNTRYFNVNQTKIRPYSLQRAYSFSIRCIKE